MLLVTEEVTNVALAEELDPVVALSLEMEELELADALDSDAETLELAEALDSETLDSDAEDAEEADDAEIDALATLAVDATMEAVLVAPWTSKAPLKLVMDGSVWSTICTYTWPAGTSGGTLKVAEPVLGTFSATTMPSVG